MTQALDAAFRAVLDLDDRDIEKVLLAALRAALPAEPPTDYLYGCYEDGMSDGQAREAWRLVRAHLLGGEA